MNYYDEIKEKLLKNEIYAKVKDYSKERNKVLTYFEVGKLLSEAGKEYGNDIIGSYAEKLAIEVGKKYNVRTLRRIRQFYNVFKDEKWSPSATVLTWSHYTELLAINDINKINYYIDICKKQSLSRNDLRNKIKSKEYERLGEETKNKLVTNEELKLPDLVPNPLLIKSEFDKKKITEYALKEAILNNLDNFLKQLGNGFLYAGNEYKIKIGNNYNYIDLLLYNVEYNCYVVIELKVTELKKEHIGQIEVYMNYVDKVIKKPYHDKTIGIIICARNNKYVIEYCSDERIFAREFKITSSKGSVKMNYYDEIKEKLLKNEIYEKVKDYSKERNKVLTYFEVGKLLSEAGKKYGNDVIGSYAEKLVNEVGKKYNRRTLYRMKQFYNLFGEQKVSTMWTQLTWSHIRELLPLKDENAIGYYLNSAINLSLTQRELSEKIKSKEYERLGDETKNKLITNEELKLPDLVPNPILIKSEFNIEQLTEYALKQSILNNLDNFLTQLGNGFSYIGNEYKLKIGNNYNYIDLLLYNVKFKCYVVVELKVTELKKEYIGQIQVYMNYIDKNVKDVSDDKTIGIIICSKNNQFIIEYCSDERIFAREFKITS